MEFLFLQIIYLRNLNQKVLKQKTQILTFDMEFAAYKVLEKQWKIVIQFIQI